MIVLGFLACSSGPEKPKNVNQKVVINQKTGQANGEGKALFTKYCVLCHGSDGKRGTNGANDLTVSKLTFNQKVAVVKKGQGVMTPFDFLGDEKIKKVVEYLETLK